MTTLSDLNAGSQADFIAQLHGIYEHSPWIAQRAAAARPFASLTALKTELQRVLALASPEEQLGLIRAHPELAGKAAIAGQLTAESTREQAKSGLNLCSADEFATLQRLNSEYNAKFGFPFILAVKGPTGEGLTRQDIIATFARRLKNRRADELAESLRQIKRIAELRLNDLFDVRLDFGPAIMQHAETLAGWSDSDYNLTCAYLTPAHQKTAAQLADWMREAGMQVHIDAVGNVVGRYLSDAPGAKTLMTGSHYDTVRNGGKYDGRLGIVLPIAVVRHLHERGEKLPFHVEIVGFAEEEGVRFKSTFSGQHGRHGQVRLVAAGAARYGWREHARRAGRRRPRGEPPSAPSRAIRPICSAMWKCISNRAPCCSSATCRWASSRRLPAVRATWSILAAWPATRAPRP